MVLKTAALESEVGLYPEADFHHVYVYIRPFIITTKEIWPCALGTQDLSQNASTKMDESERYELTGNYSSRQKPEQT